ncbi:membrane protein [Bacillus coahuilensis p1.1.43]|uniref:Membrane protein n=1 Tax=Bacillus coahuilensis p1.1.43 TaxID=1150625 RepID=A0A147K7N5_9BACI|nr:HD family phosphohydrolase [Bacillus coahuilensis]KUP06024.1 membrane protein [Bacillus coahuilensis p1.1.43]
MKQYLMKVRQFLSYKTFTLLIFLLLGLILFGLMYSNVNQETYEYQLYSLAEEDVFAPKTIIDQVKTDEKREEAAESVAPVYTYNEETKENRISFIQSVFDEIMRVKEDSVTIQEPNEENLENSEPQKIVLPISEQLKTLKARLTNNVTEDITGSLSDEVFLSLLAAEEQVVERASEIVTEKIDSVMSTRIRNDQLPFKKQEIEILIEDNNLPKEVKEASISIGRYAIVPNEQYNADQTETAKEKARNEVTPDYIMKGMLIVQEGGLIDQEIYRQLSLLGYTDQETSYTYTVGLALFVVVIVVLFHYYFTQWMISEEKKTNYVLLLSIVMVFSILLMKIISLLTELDINYVGFIFPAAMAPMILRILLNDRIAMIMAVAQALCGSVIFHEGIFGNFDVEIFIYLLISGLSGSLFMVKQHQRASIMQVGGLLTLLNVVVVLVIIFLNGTQFETANYLDFAFFSLLSGIGSAVLTIGFLPFFEAAFGILSHMRLLELSNPNHPLLKKILTEAPGTYHHSVMVGNLAEAACDAIGANSLLARVGCYYHDIGKTKRPQFFIENQMSGDNPHDRISPETSRDIIIDHSVNGAEILSKYKMPKEIIDIAKQHHGTTLLKFFYYKAKEMRENVKEEDYRYPGPKPQTKEVAIISIADSVEAAVRAMSQPSSEKIQKLVHSIVQDRILDGQFSECAITLKELDVVKHVLCDTLNSIYHSRIEYPEEKKEKDS